MARPRVALLGLGLMGSSLARALRAHKLASHLGGYAPSAATRKRARALVLVDEIHARAEDCVAQADIVFLCAPVGQMERLAAKIAPALLPKAIVTDVGSVKQALLARVRRPLLGQAYVPAHPIAGTEETGPDAGFAELFASRFCILTPPPKTPRRAVAVVRRLWQQIGARVVVMPAAHHDAVLALTSHLPHLVAYGLAGTAKNSSLARREIVNFSAGGFRDFTRIAASDPIMWRDIFLLNRDPVLKQLRAYQRELTKLERALVRGDGKFLQSYFRSVRRLRHDIVKAGQETAVADFGRRAKSAPRQRKN